MITKLTKIFFGNVDKKRIIKNKNFNVGFWGSDDHFKKLGNPIDWEHGVLQLFQNNYDEIWWTISGQFNKLNIENFDKLKNQLNQIHPDFKSISDIVELISNGGSLFDIKDDFDYDDFIIEGEDDNEFINLENYNRIKLEENNSIWIFEVLRYKDIDYQVEGEKLNLKYDYSDDLNLDERFISLISLKL